MYIVHIGTDRNDIHSVHLRGKYTALKSRVDDSDCEILAVKLLEFTDIFVAERRYRGVFPSRVSCIVLALGTERAAKSVHLSA